MPSKIESFGQVAAESLSCGTPVVCFQTSGLNDIIEDGKSGLFAQPFSYESFASKIIQLIELSPSERQEFGKRGRSFVQSHFSPQAIKPKYLEILKEAYTKRSKS
jgi:glycosyltransferase involved in cell wall biosynthesis